MQDLKHLAIWILIKSEKDKKISPIQKAKPNFTEAEREKKNEHHLFHNI